MTKRKKDSYFFDKIVSVEEVGLQRTYDFTIPGTNCFFGNGVLVHNSGAIEEDADCLITLTDVTKKKEFGEEPKNQLGIKMVQRHGRSGATRVNFDPRTGRYEQPEDE